MTEQNVLLLLWVFYLCLFCYWICHNWTSDSMPCGFTWGHLCLSCIFNGKWIYLLQVLWLFGSIMRLILLSCSLVVSASVIGLIYWSHLWISFELIAYFGLICWLSLTATLMIRLQGLSCLLDHPFPFEDPPMILRGLLPTIIMTYFMFQVRFLTAFWWNLYNRE